jgi:YggT family protein
MNVGGAFYFLIDTIFNVYIYFVIARFILQVVRADFYNPLSQAIVKVTSPLLMPLRKVIPGFGKIDVACLVLLLFVIFIKLVVIIFLFGGGFMDPVAFIYIFLRAIASAFINFFILVIFIAVILSWVAMGTGYNPAFDVIRQLSDPVIRPVRQIVPPLGMFDLSPMIVLFLLYFLKRLFSL